ncbi:MAG: tetratricopeptide repeat protein [Syntrophales bacterium]
MSDNYISPLRLRADELNAAGLPDEAAVLYKKLAEENPDEDSHLLCLAWALNDSGQRAAAVECFEELFRRELARGLVADFAFDELVRIHREEENWEALLAVCRRAAAVKPDDAGFLQTMAEASLRAGLTTEAVDIYRKLVKLDPDAPEAWGALGGALIATGNIEDGEAAYQRAAQSDPEAAVVYLDRLAGALLQAEALEKAIAVWNDCAVRQPDNPVYSMAIGECFVCLGQLDAAFAAFGRAASVKPAAAGECWRRLGDLLQKSGNLIGAAESYARATAAEPQNAFYLLRLASCYAAQEKNDLAAAILNRVKTL